MDTTTKLFLIRLFGFILYLNTGAVVFMLIEGKRNVEQESNFLRRNSINITSRLNMTEDEFLHLIANFSQAHKAVADVTAWSSYKTAVTYTTQMLTTIGYGNITTATPEGQIVTIFYALIGIPLCLLTLKAMGAHYNHLIYRILKWCETKCLKRDEVKNTDLKVMLFNIFIAMTFLFVASVHTHFTENWTYLQSVYAWFITITTVGFGDYIPKHADTIQILTGLSFMSAVLDAVGSLMEKTDFKKLLLCRNNCGRITAPRDQDDSSANQEYNMKGNGTGFKDAACQTDDVIGSTEWDVRF